MSSKSCLSALHTSPQPSLVPTIHIHLPLSLSPQHTPASLVLPPMPSSILNLKFKVCRTRNPYSRLMPNPLFNKGNKSFVAFSNLGDSESLTKTWKVRSERLCSTLPYTKLPFLP